MNFYILQFLQNNFTKILRYEEENQKIQNNYAERRLRRREKRAVWIEIKKILEGFTSKATFQTNPDSFCMCK